MAAALAKVNPKSNQSLPDWLIDYNEGHLGMLRTVSVINKAAKVGIEFSNSPPPVLKELQRDSGIALGAFGITQVPGSTLDAYRAIQQLGRDDNVGILKKILKAFKSVMTALRNWASTLHIFTANPTFRLIDKVAKLGKDSSDFSIVTDDYIRASNLSDVSNGIVKEAVDHSKSYFLLRLIKNITAIASGIFALSAMVFNFTMVPALAAALVSLVSTVLSVQVDYMRDTGPYKVINFDRIPVQ